MLDLQSPRELKHDKKETIMLLYVCLVYQIPHKVTICQYCVATLLSFPQVNKITSYLTDKTVSSVKTSSLAKTGTSFLLNSSILGYFRTIKLNIRNKAGLIL